MKLRVKRSRFAAAALGLALALTLGACSHDIGDSCKTSVDCDPNGTRSCDLSQPNGYCTIIGCDSVSALCPSSSACIRLFPLSILPNAPATCDPVTKPCPADQTCSKAGLCLTPCDATNPCTDPRQFCTTAGQCAECNPACEDVSDQSCAGQPTNQCPADEICLDAGFCAKQSQEQRECAKTCSSNSDCRGGYSCRPTGAMGSMLLSTDPNATTAFCAPDVQPISPGP
jgi:hypothetical protein